MSTKETEEATSSENNKGKRRKHKPDGFEEWGGYMAAKKAKLSAQFEGLESKIETCIFKGIAIFVNGYTNPPADELKRLMSAHGGKYHHYYSTSKTTHVVASNLPHGKMKNLKTQIVVTADWITDSIQAGKLLPHQSYLLYTPEQVDKQQRLQFKTDIAEKTEISPPNEKSFESGKPNHSIMSNITALPSDDNKNSNTTSTRDTSLANAGHFQASPHKSASAITARHPDFLSEFYNNSRLHHISTAGQELKRYVKHLAENNKERVFPSREKLRNLAQEKVPLIEPIEMFCDVNEKCKSKLQNTYMHLDMDCFFVSVGLKKHPELRGFPVAVTHAKGNRGGPQQGSDIHYEAAHYANESKRKIGGLTTNQETELPILTNEKPKISIHSKEYGSLSEIASCSYEARKAGLRNGMFLGEALRRCPNLKTIPYDFEGYSEVSKQLYNIVASYTLDIEAISCDELYIDCKELLQDTQVSAEQFASVLRSEIEETTGCTASAGIGSNMLLARLANKVAKPNGQYHILNSEVEYFMKDKKIGDLPGVGYSTSKKLEHLGVVTCGDLQTWSLEKLQKEFGPKTGNSLFNRCRGNDDRKVQLQKDRKSVSAEINYGIRFEKEEDIYKFINDLSIEVQNRLTNINSKGKSLTLKLMVRKSDAPVETAKFMGHGVCDHLSKSITLRSATDCSKVIANECCTIARSLKIKPQDYRGVGIQLSKLESAQREGQSSKTIKSFLCTGTASTSKEQVEIRPKKNDVSPKKLANVKPLPNKHTIQHFLGNKPETPKKRNTFDDYVYGEPNQSFLDALPEDLKEEVLKTCRGSPAKQSNPSSSKTLSTVSNQNKPEAGTSSDPNELDQSVLNALPEELRKEVLETYRAPVDMGQPSTSSELPESTNNEQDSKKGGCYVVLVTDSGAIRIPLENKPSAVRRPRPVKKATANLGGAFELDDIRSLLKEWVHSTNEPDEDDIADLNNFLLEAVAEGSLNKTEMVLKYLYRLVKPTTDAWKKVYSTVLSNVQKKMQEIYEGNLSAYPDFPS